jgi:hypothetical protein
MGLTDRIFISPSVKEYAATQAARSKELHPAHDVAAIKTYRYLRLGMLAAVAALSYSILEERYAHGVHCFIGSISGYYYSPVHPVFIGVMVSVGVALLVIKGRTVVEDTCLSLAGVLAPIVAFIPTTFDPSDKCGSEMAIVGHYLPPAKDPRVAANSISNDLHAYLFAGSVAIGLLLVAAFVQRRRSNRPDATTTMNEYTAGTWWSLAAAAIFVVIGWLLVAFDYSLVIQGHAWAALGMFAFLAIAALSNGILGILKNHTKIQYSVIYIIIAALMVVSGAVFMGYRYIDRSAFNGHVILYIEIVELTLFTAFWAIQTIERWHDTV